LKCSKKKIVKHIPAAARVEVKAGAQPVRAVPRPAQASTPKRHKGPRAPKAAMLTPELRKRIREIYESEYANRESRLKETHAEIADKLWVKRQLVADVLKEVLQTNNELSDAMKQRAIQMYQRFVESGHRPDGGRRRAISAALDVPYKQVMNLIREWSLEEYGKSPTPSPTRQQLFEVEKTYWAELEKKETRLTEMPQIIAERLGYITRWQVLRWLDVLHDDERAFLNVPDPPEETRELIVNAYLEYLSQNSPPEHGLHYTLSKEINKVTPRQVHKVLQAYRHKKRADYPLV
jgi:hypothetical protein